MNKEQKNYKDEYPVYIGLVDIESIYNNGVLPYLHDPTDVCAIDSALFILDQFRICDSYKSHPTLVDAKNKIEIFIIRSDVWLPNESL